MMARNRISGLPVGSDLGQARPDAWHLHSVF
jgi:hypothetical protein